MARVVADLLAGSFGDFSHSAFHCLRVAGIRREGERRLHPIPRGGDPGGVGRGVRTPPPNKSEVNFSGGSGGSTLEGSGGVHSRSLGVVFTGRGMASYIPIMICKCLPEGLTKAFFRC